MFREIDSKDGEEVRSKLKEQQALPEDLLCDIESNIKLPQ